MLFIIFSDKCKFIKFSYLHFLTLLLVAPTIKINEITTRNGEYYVVWDLVKNGGGKLKKISLEYGQVRKRIFVSSVL